MESWNPNPEAWGPLTGMPDGAARWSIPGYGELAAEWRDIRSALKDRERPRAFVDLWPKERLRAFAIETGQIEGLYTLRRGVTEQLIAEGFSGAVGAHTLENLEDRTIRGLLQDQEAALHMIFDDIAGGRPLTAHTVPPLRSHPPFPGREWTRILPADGVRLRQARVASAGGHGRGPRRLCRCAGGRGPGQPAGVLQSCGRPCLRDPHECRAARQTFPSWRAQPPHGQRRPGRRNHLSAARSG